MIIIISDHACIFHNESHDGIMLCYSQAMAIAIDPLEISKLFLRQFDNQFASNLQTKWTPAKLACYIYYLYTVTFPLSKTVTF